MGILNGKVLKKETLKNTPHDINQFPWMKFKEEDIIFPDNPRKSIILKKYHDPLELDDKVKEAKDFKQALEKKTTPLYPIDLTEDYEQGIKELIKRKRRRMMGEEEAMALELAEIDASHNTKFSDKYTNDYKERLKQNAQENFKSSTFTSPLKGDKLKDNAEKTNEINHEDTQLKMEELTNQEETNTDINPHSSTPPENTMGNMTMQVENTAPYSSEQNSTSYEKKQEILEQNEKNKEKNEEEQKQKLHEGYEKGYLDGFKTGEEKAIISQESKYESVFQNVALVVQQVEKLKDMLYRESKEVFIEIIKICSENILRQQIKYSDEALFKLFDEVNDSISKKSSIKIELNGEDLVRMKKHIISLGIEDRVTLKEDKEKESGDFNVESDRGLSIINLKKNIETIVEKLKKDLFSETDNEPRKVS